MRLVDASSYQGRADWGRARDEGGIHGAWLKATEGIRYRNPYFEGNRVDAGHAGVRVGAYHYAKLERSGPLAEADHFCNVVWKLGPRDLRPVLDYEQPSDMTPGQALRWIQTWNREVKKRLGVWPIFYSYPAMIDHLRLKAPVGGGLWLASYSVDDGRPHPFLVPRPWRKVVAHQFTSRGRVPGFKGLVDVSDAPRLLPLLAFPARGLL